MQYYTPKYLIVITLVAALISSFCMPITGIFSSRYQYVLINANYNDDFEQDRNAVAW